MHKHCGTCEYSGVEPDEEPCVWCIEALKPLCWVRRPDRDFLGRLVRLTWMTWAKTQPDPKPSWLDSYDSLPPEQQEVDRLIGERIAEVSAVHANREINRLAAEVERLRSDGRLWMDRAQKAEAEVKRLLGLSGNEGTGDV